MKLGKESVLKPSRDMVNSFRLDCSDNSSKNNGDAGQSQMHLNTTSDKILLNPRSLRVNTNKVHHVNLVKKVDVLMPNSLQTKDSNLFKYVYSGQSIDQSECRKSDNCVIDISQNIYNRTNHEIHECLWCPCLLYSLFICCIPALLYMHKSDKRYSDNLHEKAKLYATISSILYCVGLILAIAIYVLIAYFVYYLNFIYKI